MSDRTPTVGDTPGQDPHADRDRARSIAVALEQENAELERAKADLRTLAEDRLTIIRNQRAHCDQQCAGENTRLRAEAHAAHQVIEQAGLLQEHYSTGPHWEIAGQLAHILNGATWEEVQEAHDG